MTKKYRILKDGEEINRIVASEEFVTSYCEANGYTCEEIIEEPVAEPETPTEPENEPVTWDILAAAYTEGVNSIDE